MKCTKCGAEIPEGSMSCPDCGTVSAPIPVRQSPFAGRRFDEMAENSRRRHRYTMAFLLALLVIAVLIAAASVIWAGGMAKRMEAINERLSEISDEIDERSNGGDVAKPLPDDDAETVEAANKRAEFAAFKTMLDAVKTNLYALPSSRIYKCEEFQGSGYDGLENEYAFDGLKNVGAKADELLNSLVSGESGVADPEGEGDEITEFTARRDALAVRTGEANKTAGFEPLKEALMTLENDYYASTASGDWKLNDVLWQRLAGICGDKAALENEMKDIMKGYLELIDDMEAYKRLHGYMGG